MTSIVHKTRRKTRTTHTGQQSEEEDAEMLYLGLFSLLLVFGEEMGKWRGFLSNVEAIIKKIISAGKENRREC